MDGKSWGEIIDVAIAHSDSNLIVDENTGHIVSVRMWDGNDRAIRSILAQDLLCVRSMLGKFKMPGLAGFRELQRETAIQANSHAAAAHLSPVGHLRADLREVPSCRRQSAGSFKIRQDLRCRLVHTRQTLRIARMVKRFVELANRTRMVGADTGSPPS